MGAGYLLPSQTNLGLRNKTRARHRKTDFATARNNQGITRQYVRFQTQLRCWNTGRPAGLFQAAGRLEDSGRLTQCMHDLLREHLTWFNENLSVPSLNGRGWRCVFWFRSDATQFIGRMWDLIAILNEEGVSVTKKWTTDPGMIVYRDDFQIGAVPGRKSVALQA